MSKEKAREVQRKLRRLNREGGYLHTGGTCFPIERVYVVDASDDILIVYWLVAGFPSAAGSDRPGGHLRALKQIEVRQISQDSHDGEQVLEFFGVHAGDVPDAYFGRVEDMPKEHLKPDGKDFRFVIASKERPPRDYMAEALQRAKAYRKQHRKECEEFELRIAKQEVPDYDYIMS